MRSVSGVTGFLAALLALAGPAGTIAAEQVPALATAGAGLCVSPAQREALRKRVAAGGKWSPATLATELSLSEAQVLAGLPDELRVGVAGEAFPVVWQGLQAWDDAVFIVRKAGHVFEVHGRVHGGEPSKQSRYFNLDDGPGLSGHLRPDLVAAIYAAELPGREGPERGLLFYDGSGQLAFEVYVPASERDPKQGVLAQFLATRAALRELPAPRCPD